MNDGPLAQRLMGLHDDLAQRFFLHQQALLDRDFGRALQHLTDYRERLLAHMQDEETLVLPRYELAGGDASDAPVRLFLGEHHNMRQFVADFVVRLRELAERPEDRRLLELFDRQATYKNLVLHHDLRERNALYPFLGQRLPPTEQQRLLAALQWSGA